MLRTIIGWPAPNKQNTGAAHGSALGDAEVKATKEILGFDPAVTFPVEEEALNRAREVAARGKALHAEWDAVVRGSGRRRIPNEGALFARLSPRELPEGWADALPEFPADPKGIATRKASGEVLTALAPVLPELWGGSADLAESNLTTMKGEPSFLPANRQSEMWPGNPYGRTLHFGIREHGMGAILNGIVLSGLTRPYGGTFLQFSDYMRGAVRLAALMEQPVTYVWTHDSIGLGEDGPTHQPVEHLWSLRNIPGLDVVRPADANETAVAWKTILEKTDRPAGLCLSRQNMPTFDRTEFASAAGVARGAYVLADGTDVILIGTGSEVQIAVAARELLAADGHLGAGCVDAVRGMVQGAGRFLPGGGASGGDAGAGLGRGGHHSPVEGCSSATPASRSASTTTARPPRRPCSTRSSASPRRRSRPPRVVHREGLHREGARLTRGAGKAEDGRNAVT